VVIGQTVKRDFPSLHDLISSYNGVSFYSRLFRLIQCLRDLTEQSTLSSLCGVYNSSLQLLVTDRFLAQQINVDIWSSSLVGPFSIFSLIFFCYTILTGLSFSVSFLCLRDLTEQSTLSSLCGVYSCCVRNSHSSYR